MIREVAFLLVREDETGASNSSYPSELIGFYSDSSLISYS